MGLSAAVYRYKYVSVIVGACPYERQLTRQEKDSEIELLKRQLEEFSVRAPAATLAAGMEGGVAVADRPAGGDWDVPSSWRPAVLDKPRCSAGG